MENMRDSLVVIVAGYPKAMKGFIESNAGLQSRFTNYISFEDYSMEEMGQIMDQKLKERGFTMTKAARDHALKLLEDDKEKSIKKDQESGIQPSFGNGRTVRNLVEKAEKILAMRLDSKGTLSKTHGGLDDKAYKHALTTITLDDVKNVSLEGIATQEEAPQKEFKGFSRALDEQEKKPRRAVKLQ